MYAETGVRRVTTLLFIAASATGFGCPKPTPTDSDAGMRELYFLSDTKAAIGDFILFANEAMAQQQPNLTDEQFDAATRVIHDHMSAERIQELVLERLANRAEREYLGETLDWLRSPLGTRAMAVEHVSWTSQGMTDMVDFMQEAEKNPPSAKRRELIERYDTASHISDRNAEAMLLAGYGTAVMMDALKPKEEQLGPEQLLKSLDSKRQLLRPLFKETMALTSLFAFRDLTDEELEAYVTFCESDAGQWFTGTLSGAFIDAIRSATENLGNAFIAALSRQPPP